MLLSFSEEGAGSEKEEVCQIKEIQDPESSFSDDAPTIHKYGYTLVP